MDSICPNTQGPHNFQPDEDGKLICADCALPKPSATPLSEDALSAIENKDNTSAAQEPSCCGQRSERASESDSPPTSLASNDSSRPKKAASSSAAQEPSQVPPSRGHSTARTKDSSRACSSSKTAITILVLLLIGTLLTAARFVRIKLCAETISTNISLVVSSILDNDLKRAEKILGETKTLLAENANSLNALLQDAAEKRIAGAEKSIAIYREADKLVKEKTQDIKAKCKALDKLTEQAAMAVIGQENPVRLHLKTLKGDLLVKEIKILGKQDIPTRELLKKISALKLKGEFCSSSCRLLKEENLIIDARLKAAKQAAQKSAEEIKALFGEKEFFKVWQALRNFHKKTNKEIYEFRPILQEAFSATLKTEVGRSDLVELNELVIRVRKLASVYFQDKEKTTESLKEIKDSIESIGEKIGWEYRDSAAEHIDRLLTSLESTATKYDDSAKSETTGSNIIQQAKTAARLIKNTTLLPKISMEDGVSATFLINGEKAKLYAREDDIGKRELLSICDYVFELSWDGYTWVTYPRARIAALMMQKNRIPTGLGELWHLVDGPGYLTAETTAKDGRRYIVIDGHLREIKPMDGDKSHLLEAFKTIADELAKTIEEDEEIDLVIRQALVPVVKSSRGITDKSDYLEPDFCRNIIEEGYLKEHLPDTQKYNELQTRYHKASTELGTTIALFAINLSGGQTLTASTSSTRILLDETRSEVYSTQLDDLTPYRWKLTTEDSSAYSIFKPTDFYFPYAVHTRQDFDNTTATSPSAIKLFHSTGAELSSYLAADKKLIFDQSNWNKLTSMDTPSSTTSGPPGWAFAPHIPIEGENGRTNTIITPNGQLENPEYILALPKNEREDASEKFLDKCAKILATPGELSLLFKYFFMYCLDSPVPSKTNLIGNLKASGDSHETAQQLIERNLAGHLVGDCDDLAEFYQVITRRQGHLSHILSLPSHAACGYVVRVDKDDKAASNEDAEKDYALIVMQTGPTYMFRADNLDDAVMKALSHFERDDGDSGHTAAAYPFLFRFAGEKVRTSYILSDRLFVDSVYAELLIRVQSYWHYHYYATAINVMEKAIETDKDVSNFLELSGLSRRICLYDKAITYSKAAMENMKRKDIKIEYRELADIASYYSALGKRDDALNTLQEIYDKTQELQDNGDSQTYFNQLMSIRYRAAGLYATLDKPFHGFDLIIWDLNYFGLNRGKLFPALRHTIISILEKAYDMRRDGSVFTQQQVNMLQSIENIVRRDITENLFEKDDSFDDLLRNYYVLGQFARVLMGRDKFSEILCKRGPYPTEIDTEKTRGTEFTEDDYAWMRICAYLYTESIVIGANKKHEDYNTDESIRHIDLMLHAVEQGRKLGSMVSVDTRVFTYRILKVMMQNDLEAFDKILGELIEFSSDRAITSAAETFGQRADFIPIEEMPKWIEVFSRHIKPKQHYFNAAHRALYNATTEHALLIADATTKLFPDEKMMQLEAKHMKELAPTLEKQIKEVGERRAAYKAEKAKAKKERKEKAKQAAKEAAQQAAEKAKREQKKKEQEKEEKEPSATK